MREETIKIYTLKEVDHKFFSGEWRIPPHQRKRAWDDKAFDRWGKKLISIANQEDEKKRLLRGSIVLYQLDETLNFYYVNDGLQRFYYGLTDFKAKYEDWKEIFSKIEISVQTPRYENLAEVLEDFMGINQGTVATPHELTKTLFYNQWPETFELFWEPKLKVIQDIYKEGFNRLGIKVEDREKKRELGHQRIRDEYHTFWKFISEDDSLFSPKVGKKNINNNWEKESELERRFINFLEKSGRKEFENQLKNFKKWMVKMAAFYEECWILAGFPKTAAPANVHFRWWLTVSVYFRNKKMMQLLPEFTKRFIAHTEGKSTIFYKNETGSNCNSTTSMANLNNFGHVCNRVNFDFPFKAKKHRAKTKLTPKTGLVNSHVQSFAIYGDGETLHENALSNLLRSAAPMTEERRSELKKVNAARKS
jgi:hypothetical protein